MGYKMTTDAFVLRGATDLTITGASGGAETTLDTSLDTLNREVLIIHEIDIQTGSTPIGAVDQYANDASVRLLSIHDAVQTATGSLNLNSTDYIGGVNTAFMVGGPGNAITVQESKNPDSRDQASKDSVPLAIITDSTIVLRSGFSASTASSASDTYQAKFRIICQRAKADADTYAALVTGLL